MRPLSDQLLRVIADLGCVVSYERAVPVGRLKRDFIFLAWPDGRAISREGRAGAVAGLISTNFQLPPEAFNDFLSAGFIEPSGPEDGDGRRLYHLTEAGREAAFGCVSV